MRWMVPFINCADPNSLTPKYNVFTTGNDVGDDALVNTPFKQEILLVAPALYDIVNFDVVLADIVAALSLGLAATPAVDIREPNKPLVNTLNIEILLETVPSEIDDKYWFVPYETGAFGEICSNSVPSLALYQLLKFVPVMLATSALRVRAVVVVGITLVANAPSSSWGRPMRRVMSNATPTV